MFKWIEHIQHAQTELTILSKSKTAKEFEQKLETLLEKLSTNPRILNSLSLALNTQAHIKSLVNFGFEKLWKGVQLPNKKDQERTLYLLHELQFKLHLMEKDITRLKSNPISSPSETNHSKARTFTVLDARVSEKTSSKLV